jgi:hypothetical protein
VDGRRTAQALEGVPGALAVRVVTAEAPDGRFVGEQLVISAGPWNDIRWSALTARQRS